MMVEAIYQLLFFSKHRAAIHDSDSHYYCQRSFGQQKNETVLINVFALLLNIVETLIFQMSGCLTMETLLSGYLISTENLVSY